MTSPKNAEPPVFVIAEAGVNHDGSPEKALKLVEIAANAGADAVKFQTFRADEVVTIDAAKADYQRRQTGEGSQYEMIRALQLDEAAHRRIADKCRECGIEFMSTPFSPWAIDLLIEIGMKRIKVASGELVNLPLLRNVARRGLPIILSTGMGTLEEVRRAVGWIRQAREQVGYSERKGDLVVLHCTSDYPAAPNAVNLRAMDTLHRELELPVGYSDHTVGTTISIAAVARGATVIEKHFTIDKAAFGPDHAASLSPEELSQMITSIRAVECAMGDGVKAPMPSELATRELVRRSAFASQPIASGDALTENNVHFLRPAGGIPPEDADRIFAASAARDIAKGQQLMAGDLE
ncbi:N-acetylneuraminate synthase [Qipengyuania sp. DY56-A-20]|uniref:N-acetylneuraminate synthase n=1 Tax=Qipengyuania benthica TaxID=3067651 RepID=A0ABT9HCI0_9SPHN|nr:N-acetylneuraminate synthase [Qipengyuania sp. DY56-A-20]MDP4540580.1 N-acetylneuraminate synthase [Qipengyuania sp. DY56-A-20]